jgi:hypothetical protein
MTNNWNGRRKAGSLVWPAALFGSGGAAGLWLGMAQGSAQVLPAAAVLAVTAVFGAVWLSRYRAARRLNAAVEIYAERELARARRRRVTRAAI